MGAVVGEAMEVKRMVGIERGEGRVGERRREEGRRRERMKEEHSHRFDSEVLIFEEGVQVFFCSLFLFVIVNSVSVTCDYQLP